MKFLADQDVYQVTVEFLRNLGHDVLRASDAGLARASDSDLLLYARDQRRIMITRDKGFGALVFLSLREHSGVILLRVTPATVDVVHEELSRALKAHSEAELCNSFVVVEPGRHRIRSSGA
jgi:predicted nuclease of predicted toxin-antitoxin system